VNTRTRKTAVTEVIRLRHWRSNHAFAINYSAETRARSARVLRLAHDAVAVAAIARRPRDRLCGLLGRELGRALKPEFRFRNPAASDRELRAANALNRLNNSQRFEGFDYRRRPARRLNPVRVSFGAFAPDAAIDRFISFKGSSTNLASDRFHISPSRLAATKCRIKNILRKFKKYLSQSAKKLGRYRLAHFERDRNLIVSNVERFQEKDQVLGTRAIFPFFVP
jgi:hypothetical protein